MRDLGAFSKEEADSYLSQILEHADNSIVGDLAWILEKSGIDR